ncbi:hypothetical protein [Mariniblastus fucicola]|uniref:Uncharacterized protein n=1 Tax=Mariniblastus fucicola TaxID=980251 RepID=A0A5B9PB62_9BACT|nr:hypothetical protein [Mariniblastus fucicola]QEG22162.1 hypothetical protein MFFC18_20230 [Mariniblastus fucicola]
MRWLSTVLPFAILLLAFFVFDKPLHGQKNADPIEPAEVTKSAQAPVPDSTPENMPARSRPGNAPKVQRSQPKNQPAAAKPTSDIEVRMPEDVNTPVLVMDFTGGYRMKLPDGFEPTPNLQIFPDGRVLTGRNTNLVKEVEGQMDLVELQALLAFIADDCRFFDITSESIKADIAAKRKFMMMDAATTKLEVNLRDHSNTVEVYALPQVADKFSDVPSVASMVAIASRCRRIIAETRVGSDEEAEASLTSVNEALLKQKVKAPEFTLEHLQAAEQYVDGRRTISFAQNFTADEKEMAGYATLLIDAEGGEKVNLHVFETPPKRNNR